MVGGGGLVARSEQEVAVQHLNVAYWNWVVAVDARDRLRRDLEMAERDEVKYREAYESAKADVRDVYENEGGNS